MENTKTIDVINEASTLVDINNAASKEGLTYGQYMAKQYSVKVVKDPNFNREANSRLSIFNH